MEGFLYQALPYLAAMVVAVPLSSRLGLGSVLGYLFAGLIIGPLLGLVGDETRDLQHFAEFGVVLMLFLIGLELEPRALWAMRDRLIGMGGMQIVLTIALIAAGAMALGLGWREALTTGAILSLSSTAIVLQTLTEKQLMQTPGGRSSFSVLLMQDIAVIPMLALLPLLALPGARALAEAEDGHGTAAMSYIESLPDWGVTFVTLSAVGLVALVGRYLINPLYRFVHGAKLREVNTAMALVIVVAIASIMLTVGLSPALGTFLAGVVLANSEFRHEIESDIAPFKGLLLGLFFITVGAGIDVALLMSQPGQILLLTLAVMTVKGAVLYGIARVFHKRRRNRWLFTLGLAQAGEFGFVLVAFALKLRVLDGGLAQELMLVIALSMLMTPISFIIYERIARRATDEDTDVAADAINEQQPVIIAGVGRFGQVVNRMVTSSGLKTTVIDNDIKTIQLLRQFGFKGYVGDPTRPDLLKAAGIESAKVLVAAMDDKDANLSLVRYARRIRPDLHIVSRAYDREHVFQLYRAGANDIVREFFDSSLRVGRYVLEAAGVTRFEANELERLFFDLDRSSLRKLAEVWRPGIPLDQNREYVALARELNRDLEMALISRSSALSATRGNPPAAAAPLADEEQSGPGGMTLAPEQRTP